MTSWTRTVLLELVTLAVLGMLATPAAAQEVSPSAFGAAGIVKVYRAEDRSFGTKLNVGGGFGIEWRRVGLDLELHTTIGLTPIPVSCNIANLPCTGSAREGFEQATMLTGNVSYSFGGPRVRPYVTGSVGALWTRHINSLTQVGASQATLSEFEERDTGLALGAGVGVDIALTPALSLRPEFRTYSAVALSRVNLGMHRAAVGVRYRW